MSRRQSKVSSPFFNSFNKTISAGENNGINIYQVAALLAIINRDNLRSIGEVERKINQLKYEQERARMEVNKMEEKCNYLKGLVKQAEEYFLLMEQPQLSAEEQLRAKMYGETLSKQGIVDRTGITT